MGRLQLILGQFGLFVAAALIGFAVGWQLRKLSTGAYEQALQADIEGLKRLLSEVQNRRARVQ
jgi:hypothetical protein